MILLIIAMLALLLIPAVQEARKIDKHTMCRNHLKQIGLAFLNYQDVHQHFPACSGSDPNLPISWRVELLPFLEQEEIFTRWNRKLNWDDRENEVLATHQFPSIYLCPEYGPHSEAGEKRLAQYVCLTGPETVFANRHAPNLRTDFPDGASHTLIAGEVRQASPFWVRPQDVSPEKLLADMRKKTTHRDYVHVLTADAGARYLPVSADLNFIRALTTPDGGEKIPDS